MCKFPEPSLPLRLITNLNQGLPSFLPSPPPSPLVTLLCSGLCLCSWRLSFLWAREGRVLASSPAWAVKGDEPQARPEFLQLAMPGLFCHKTAGHPRHWPTPGARCSAYPFVARFGDASEHLSFQTVLDINRPDSDLIGLRKFP